MYTRRHAPLLLVCCLAGCAALPATNPDDFPRHSPWKTNAESTVAPIEIPLSQRLAYPEPRQKLETTDHETLYSFVISNMEIGEALHQFGRAYGLNIAIDRDVVGIAHVDFRDLRLDQAMSLMLDPFGYYWTYDDGILKVRSMESRHFSVDYLRLVRSGEGSSTAKVSSGVSSGGSDGGDAGGEEDDAGSIVIGHQDEVHFWEELEEQVDTLLSPAGEAVLNRLSGTLVVTDQHRHVENVGQFLSLLEHAIHRQVDIQVSILEVSLEDTAALGVDWQKIAEVVNPTDAISYNLNGRVVSPAGGIEARNDVLNLGYADQNGPRQLDGLLTALAHQGDVQIVSQPHVRAMNNQTALIKVGTDRTFFRREQSTDSTSAGSITTSTDVPQVVTEGVVLSITPQISANGWIMMDISPVVTRVSSVTTVQGGGGEVQSSAPNLDVAQVTSLVRARSGDTVVIGGLIQTVDSRTERNLPGTRWMGPFRAATGGSYNSKVKKELVMVLQPLVVDGAG